MLSCHLVRNARLLDLNDSTGGMVSDSIDLHAEQQSKREQVDLKYLSEWKDQIKELVVERITSLKEKIRSPKDKIPNGSDLKDTMRRLFDDFVLVPADKAANDMIVLCKKYYIQILFRQFIGIPMGTNCAPLLADLFLYSYENEFLDIMIKYGHRKLGKSFNLCYQ